ncbi:hypothetical protein BsWGS_20933 [Bradybaena similaris]
MAATKIKGLQQWCRRMTDGYAHVDIANFTTAWRDGMAFCALIHRFRPDLIDYDALSPENVLDNCKLAFEIAEQELDIPAFLEADDMARLKCPDKLSVITYVSQYYNNLSTLPQLGGPGVRGKVSNKTMSGTKRPSDADILSAPAVKKPPVAGTKENSIPAPSRVAPILILDKCAICHNRVYLLERHMEGGKLYHRSCFRHSELSPTNKVYTRSPFMSPSLNSETVSFTYPSTTSRAPVSSDTEKRSKDSTLNAAGETKTTSIIKKAESAGTKHVLADPVTESTKKSKLQSETSLNEEKSKKASEIKDKLQNLKAKYSMSNKSSETASALPLSGKEARKMEKKRDDVLSALKPLGELAKGAKRNVPLILQQSDKLTAESSRNDLAQTSTATTSASSPLLVTLATESSATNSPAVMASPSKISSVKVPSKLALTNKTTSGKKHERHAKDVHHTTKVSKSTLPEPLSPQNVSGKSDVESNETSKIVPPVARPRTPRSNRKILHEEIVAMKYSLKAVSDQKNKDMTPKPAPRRNTLESPEKTTPSGQSMIRKSKLHSEPAVDEVDSFTLSTSNNISSLPMSAPPPLPASAPPPLPTSHPVGQISSSMSGTSGRKPSFELTSQEIKTFYAKASQKSRSSEQILLDIYHEADSRKSRTPSTYNTQSDRTRAQNVSDHIHVKAETIDDETNVNRLRSAPKPLDRRWSSPIPTNDQQAAGSTVPSINENDGQVLTGLLATLAVVRNQKPHSPSSHSRTLRSLSSPSDSAALDPPLLPPRSNPRSPTRFTSSPKIYVDEAHPTSPSIPRRSSSPVPDRNINTVSADQQSQDLFKQASSPTIPPVPRRSSSPVPDRNINTVSADQWSQDLFKHASPTIPPVPRRSSSPVPNININTISSDQPCQDSFKYPSPTIQPVPRRSSSPVPDININTISSDQLCQDLFKHASPTIPPVPRRSSSPVPDRNIHTISEDQTATNDMKMQKSDQLIHDSFKHARPTSPSILRRSSSPVSERIMNTISEDQTTAKDIKVPQSEHLCHDSFKHIKPTSPSILRRSSSPVPDKSINTIPEDQTAANDTKVPKPDQLCHTSFKQASPAISPVPRRSSSPAPDRNINTVTTDQLCQDLFKHAAPTIPPVPCRPSSPVPNRNINTVSADQTAANDIKVPTSDQLSHEPFKHARPTSPSIPRRSSSPVPNRNNVNTASADRLCEDTFNHDSHTNADKSSKVLYKPKVTSISIRDDSLDSAIDDIYSQNLSNDRKSDSFKTLSDSKDSNHSPLRTKRSITSIESVSQNSKEQVILSDGKDLTANTVSSACIITEPRESKERLGAAIQNAAFTHIESSSDIAPQKPPRLHKILKSANHDNLPELPHANKKNDESNPEHMSHSFDSNINQVPSIFSASISQSEAVDMGKFQTDQELPQWKKDIEERKKKLREDIARSESENVKLKYLKEKNARKVTADSKTIEQKEDSIREYNAAQDSNGIVSSSLASEAEVDSKANKGKSFSSKSEENFSKAGLKQESGKRTTSVNKEDSNWKQTNTSNTVLMVSGKASETQDKIVLHSAEESVSQIVDRTRENIIQPSNGVNTKHGIVNTDDAARKKAAKLKDSELEFMINKAKYKSMNVNVDISLEDEYEKAEHNKQSAEWRNENSSEPCSVKDTQHTQSLDAKRVYEFEADGLNNKEKFKGEHDEDKATSGVSHIRHKSKSSVDSIRSQDSQHYGSEDEENRRASVLSEEKILLQTQSEDSSARGRQPSPKVKRKITVLGRNSKEKLTSPPTSPAPMKKIEVIAKFDFEENSSDFESSLSASTASLSIHDKHVPPPRPPPPRLPHKMMPPPQISAIELQQQLLDIDGRLTELEMRGRDLEESIRNENTLEEDEDRMIHEWFRLVGERNELVRKEADLAYISREQELEDEQEHIESQLRYLISKPDGLKSAEERQEEEYLIKRKMELVEERNMIIDSMDEDRLRYEIEDRDMKMMREKGLWRTPTGSPIKEKRNSNESPIKEKKNSNESPIKEKRNSTGSPSKDKRNSNESPVKEKKMSKSVFYS